MLTSSGSLLNELPINILESPIASVASGADGLIIEVHRDPSVALSDKDQALIPTQFAELVRKTRMLRDSMENLK